MVQHLSVHLQILQTPENSVSNQRPISAVCVIIYLEIHYRIRLVLRSEGIKAKEEGRRYN